MPEKENDTSGKLSALTAAPVFASSLLNHDERSDSEGSDSVREAFRPSHHDDAEVRMLRLLGRWTVRIVIFLVCCPLILLLQLSLGSGWAFPNLLPDRLDGAPWSTTFGTGSSLVRAVGTSVFLSITTASISTSLGFLLARWLRHQSGLLVNYVLYLPFVVSPVVAGVCAYDLTIRLHLAGSFPGVLLIQCLFATCFSAIYFREALGHRLERIENLIRMLGGDSLSVWQHGIWPQCRGLIVICLIQTALYSWLDYGLVSVIGGGNVIPLTVRLFGYIREASTNMAALASLMLMMPAIAGLFLIIVKETTGRRVKGSQLKSSLMRGGIE